MNSEVEQLTLYGQDTWCGKTYQGHSARQAARTSGPSWRKLAELQTAPCQYLDLRAGYGNLLGSFWEVDSPLLGESWTLNTGASPSAAKESSLSQILQDTVPDKYYLSKTACLGILRRAKARGKELPAQLKTALEIQAGISH